MDGHLGLSVSEDDAINCVSNSLFTFLNLMYCGQNILNQDGNPEDSEYKINQNLQRLSRQCTVSVMVEHGHQNILACLAHYIRCPDISSW